MTGDPPDITTAEITVAGVDVKDIFACHGSAEEVACGGVHNTLGLASRTRSVEEEKRVFGVHGLGSDISRPFVDLLMPPPIPTLGKWYVGACPLVNENMADVGALFESVIHDLLSSDEFSATLALIGGDDHFGFGVDDSVAE